MEREELNRRARSHGMRAAVYLQSLLTPRAKATAASADDWWDSLPADRWAQVHRWLTQRGHAPEGPIPGQLEMHP